MNGPVTEELADHWWKLHVEYKMTATAIAKRSGYDQSVVAGYLRKRRTEADIGRPKSRDAVSMPELRGRFAADASIVPPRWRKKDK